MHRVTLAPSPNFLNPAHSIWALYHCVHVQEKESAFAEKSKDAFEESDDESAISRTESELREVTKV